MSEPPPLARREGRRAAQYRERFLYQAVLDELVLWEPRNLMENLIRFLAGGIIVSAFALLGDVLRPNRSSTSPLLGARTDR